MLSEEEKEWFYFMLSCKVIKGQHSINYNSCQTKKADKNSYLSEEAALNLAQYVTDRSQGLATCKVVREECLWGFNKRWNVKCKF